MGTNKNNKKHSSGMDLLYDIFGENPAAVSVGTGLLEALPAFLNSLASSFKQNLSTESENAKSSDEVSGFKDAIYNSCINKMAFNKDGNYINKIVYHIDSKLYNDCDAYTKWLNKVCSEHFVTAYKFNCNAHRTSKEYVSEIQFEIYVEGSCEHKENIAVTPWIWDREMLSFYHLDEDNNAHYIRFVTENNDVYVARNENGVMITDVITPEDRKDFLSMINEQKEDASACDISEKEDTADMCDTMSEDNTEQNLNEGTGQSVSDVFEAIADMHNCKVHAKTSQSVDPSDYSYLVRKTYKDIIYRQSCNRKQKPTIDDLLALFAFALEHKNYEYNIVNDKVILAVSYEKLFENIITTDNDLPWFALSADSEVKYDFVPLNEIDQKEFIDRILETYNFNEVAIIEKDDLYGYNTNYIFCTFNVM